jgi:hypothetical protein
LGPTCDGQHSHAKTISFALVQHEFATLLLIGCVKFAPQERCARLKCRKFSELITIA